ncbi:MAG TPA: AraC family transcriptional regulator [Steroidobacteraceae bacterium]|nr:AraC family transcriptional regulator [Steroidobacteraceae bacterium]
MTFWPETRLAGICTEAKIADPTAYGLAPGPAGYRVADLRCAPAIQPQPQGVYTQSGVALVLSGMFEHLGDNRACMAVPGSLVFANKGAEFSFRHQGAEGNRRIVVFFSEELLEELAAELRLEAPRFQAVSAPPSRLTPKVAGLLLKIARGAVDSDEAAVAIANLSLSAGERSTAAGASDHDTRRVLEAVRYINTHFAEPCPLDTLAAVAGLSRFRFAKRFRAVTGETANQYVINRRLSAAATRLAATKAPIAEIAFEVGFNDLSYFDACFRSAFGCAPSIWRRR